MVIGKNTLLKNKSKEIIKNHIYSLFFKYIFLFFLKIKSYDSYDTIFISYLSINAHDAHTFMIYVRNAHIFLYIIKNHVIHTLYLYIKFGKNISITLVHISEGRKN